MRDSDARGTLPAVEQGGQVGHLGHPSSEWHGGLVGQHLSAGTAEGIGAGTDRGGVAHEGNLGLSVLLVNTGPKVSSFHSYTIFLFPSLPLSMHPKIDGSGAMFSIMRLDSHLHVTVVYSLAS